MESIGDVLKDMASRQALAGPRRGPERPGALTLDSGPRHDPACLQCGGKGWYVRETGEMVRAMRRNPDTKRDEPVMVPYQVSMACSCVTVPTARAVQSAEAGGLGGMLVAKTLDTFEPGEIHADDWAAVQAWAAGLPGSLSEHAGWLLAGSVGNGKTHLAAALLHTARRGGVRVRFIEETAFIREIQATYSHDDHRDRLESEAGVMASLITVPLLCLDDLGQGYVPGYANAQDGATWLSSHLYSLLNGRMTACKPTIITSNLKRSALAARLGDGATSRLDALRLVLFTGRDRR